MQHSLHAFHKDKGHSERHQIYYPFREQWNGGVLIRPLDNIVYRPRMGDYPRIKDGAARRELGG